MNPKQKFWLIPAIINGLIALLHLVVIAGGAEWYRFFGAGEQMARLAEQGSAIPSLVTLSIAAVFLVWCGCCLCAAGQFKKFPLLRPVLTLITGLFLLRGLAGLAIPLCYRQLVFEGNSPEFWIWSSLTCVVIGLLHLNALVDNWGELKNI